MPRAAYGFGLAARGGAAMLCSTLAVHAWCAAVFMALGYSLAESAPLSIAAPALPLIAALEGALSQVSRWIRPMGPIGAAQTGFFIAVTFSAAWLHLSGERVLGEGNAADIALAGLVLGIPAGLFSHQVGKATRDIVDSLARVL